MKNEDLVICTRNHENKNLQTQPASFTLIKNNKQNCKFYKIQLNIITADKLLHHNNLQQHENLRTTFAALFLNIHISI